MLAELGDVAGRHRAAVSPGAELTDEQYLAHAGMVADELEARGIVAGAREWYTAQRVDGRICGRWAHSWHEAALELAFHGRLAWLVADSRLEAHGEYYPYGRRAGDRETFPVTPAPATRAELAMLETPAGALF